MKQQNGRMIAEVNKIIGNTLVKDGGLYLPSIGSLSVTATPPSVGGTAPKRVISFTTEERQRSLVATISERGGCTPQQATLIYDKWLTMVNINSVVTIEGVGVISDGHFSERAELSARLNPVTAKVKEQSTSTKRGGTAKRSTERRGGASHAIIWVIAAAVVITAAVMVYNRSQSSFSESPRQMTVTTEQPQQASPEPKSAPKSTSESTPELTEAAPQVAQSDKAIIAEPQKEVKRQVEQPKQSSKAKPYKVIYGAFSTAENVNKAIAQVKRKLGNDIECSVLKHGKSQLVSIYETDDFTDAKRFSDNAEGKINQKLWIHKRYNE